MITLPRAIPNVSENAILRLPEAPRTLYSPIFEPNDADIVPDPIQNRLMYWRDIFRIGQFDIGDLTAEVVMLNAQSGMHITHKRIFKAVSTFCGKTPRTVRYYYETAVFYPEEVRQMYDALPFSHFVEARVFGDQWKSYLETAMLYPHKGTDYVRYLMTSQSLTPDVASPFVAVGVAVGVASGTGVIPDPSYSPSYTPNDDKKNKTCEDSQDRPINPVNIHTLSDGDARGKQSCEVSQDYACHDAIGRVDALISAINECLPVIDQTEMPQNVKTVILVSCADLLTYLPRVGEFIARAESAV